MFEIYDSVIDTKEYTTAFLFPDQFQNETTPAGLFVHTPDHILEKMGIGSGVGVDGARDCVSVVTLSHADEGKTVFDFTEYCSTVTERKISGLKIHTESQSFIAPIVAMRRTDAQTMQVIVYTYPAEASSMIST